MSEIEIIAEHLAKLNADYDQLEKADINLCFERDECTLSVDDKVLLGCMRTRRKQIEAKRGVLEEAVAFFPAKTVREALIVIAANSHRLDFIADADDEEKDRATFRRDKEVLEATLANVTACLAALAGVTAVQLGLHLNDDIPTEALLEAAQEAKEKAVGLRAPSAAA